jgi:hypothetical protein
VRTDDVVTDDILKWLHHHGCEHSAEVLKLQLQ